MMLCVDTLADLLLRKRVTEVNHADVSSSTDNYIRQKGSGKTLKTLIAPSQTRNGMNYGRKAEDFAQLSYHELILIPDHVRLSMKARF